MKLYSYRLLTLLIVLLAFVLTSCPGVFFWEYYEVDIYEPQYISYKKLRTGVTNKPVRKIANTGKIYLKDNWIFINELKKGIHVIDNRDPSNPRALSFLPIPGNIDMAVKGNFLYADSYVDLVVLDISDIHNIKECSRKKDFFSYNCQRTFSYMAEYKTPDPSKGVVIGYKHVGTKIEYGPILYADAAIGSGSPGMGGSMARFTVTGDWLYLLKETNLVSLSLEDPANPEIGSTQHVGWGIETIFPMDEKLFIGSMTGMFIYDISVPFKPEPAGTFFHFTSCDPVVARGNYAYVTLRSGTMCANGLNALFVLDIEDITDPRELAVYSMYNPHGLGVDGNLLFICDGEAGLKIYDSSNPGEVLPGVAFFNDREDSFFDVIPNNGIAFVIGAKGLYQYDYSDPGNISLLSFYPAQKEM